MLYLDVDQMMWIERPFASQSTLGLDVFRLYYPRTLSLVVYIYLYNKNPRRLRSTDCEMEAVTSTSKWSRLRVDLLSGSQTRKILSPSVLKFKIIIYTNLGRISIIPCQFDVKKKSHFDKYISGSKCSELNLSRGFVARFSQSNDSFDKQKQEFENDFIIHIILFQFEYHPLWISRNLYIKSC